MLFDVFVWQQYYEKKFDWMEFNKTCWEDGLRKNPLRIKRQSRLSQFTLITFIYFCGPFLSKYCMNTEGKIRINGGAPCLGGWLDSASFLGTVGPWQRYVHYGAIFYLFAVLRIFLAMVWLTT